MIGKTVKVTISNFKYEIPVTGKFNVITGESATGKSSMLKFPSAELRSGRDFVHVENEWTLDLICTQDYFNVCVMDEDFLRTLPNSSINLMLQSNCCFVIITRDIDERLPVNYKDIYVLKQSGKYYYCKRKYPDFEELYLNAKRYICEDSKSGYLYYASVLENVISSDGKSNIKNFAHSDDVAIADGSAIGSNIDVLSEIGCSLYLPISFEYLCYVYLHNHSINWDTLYSGWDIRKHASLERYFTELLTDTCLKTFNCVYSKREFPAFLRNVPISKFLGIRTHNYDELQWCKDHAPNSLKELPDEELLKEMLPLYYKYRNEV